MTGESDSELSSPIHITALDGIIHVNSLFTFAVFVGLAWNPRDPNNRLTDDPNCQAGPKIAENLVSFHVISFASFLFSSLVSLCLKQALRWPRSGNHHALDLAHLNKIVVRVGYVVCAAGSVSGCVFLMLALMNLVQIKLGTLACGSRHSYGAVVPLGILVPAGLFIYVGFILYAFFSR